MNGGLTILGLESSCDDTAAAVVRHRPGARPEILTSQVSGQIDLHAEFGRGLGQGLAVEHSVGGKGHRT